MTEASKKAEPRIYLDYAAATPLDERVKAAMEPYWRDVPANPGASHEEGRAAKRALEDARGRIAELLNVVPDEITFTSGGTEANNLAIFGTTTALQKQGAATGHAVTSAIEHPSVLDVFRELETRGTAVSYLPVGGDGCIDAHTVRDVLTPATGLVSIFYVNSEIGTVQPLADIARVIRKHRNANKDAVPYFHTDASQAPLFLDCRPDKLGVDLMTLDAQKVYGPKGVGLLYHRRGLPLSPIFHGGGQERGLRPGTENVPLIVGFAEALGIAVREREESARAVVERRDAFMKQLIAAVPEATINGSQESRVANNVSITVPGVSSEYLVALLDARGIAAATKSACLSDDGSASYVLAALGDGREGNGAVRFSLGKETTAGELESVARAFAESVAIARKAPAVAAR